jgi:hypothetical protein
VNNEADPEVMFNWFNSKSLSERLLIYCETNNNTIHANEILKNSPSFSLISSDSTLENLFQESQQQIQTFNVRELQNFTSIQFLLESFDSLPEVISRVNELKIEVESNADLKNFLDILLTISIRKSEYSTSDIISDEDLINLEEQSLEWRDINNESRLLQLFFFKDFSLDQPQQIRIMNRLLTDLKELEPINYMMIILVLSEIVNSKFYHQLVPKKSLYEFSDNEIDTLKQFLDNDKDSQFLKSFCHQSYNLSQFDSSMINLCISFYHNMKLVSNYPLFPYVPELENSFFYIISSLVGLNFDNVTIWNDILTLIQICPNLISEKSTMFFELLLIKTLVSSSKMRNYNPFLINQKIEPFPEEFIANANEIIQKMEIQYPTDAELFPRVLDNESFDLLILAELLYKELFNNLAFYSFLSHIKSSENYVETFNIIYLKLEELTLTNLNIAETILWKMVSFDKEKEREQIQAKYEEDSEEYHLSMNMLESVDHWFAYLLHNFKEFNSNYGEFVQTINQRNENQEIVEKFQNIVKIIEQR